MPSLSELLVLHLGITPLGNGPEWFNITRFYPEMCLNGVNTQWVYSQGVNGVTQKTLRLQDLEGTLLGASIRQVCKWGSLFGAYYSKSLS